MKVVALFFGPSFTLLWITAIEKKPPARDQSHTDGPAISGDFFCALFLTQDRTNRTGRDPGLCRG